MANAREIVKRRKSVSNICKITRTMEMIATARFKKAFDTSVGARPYTEKIAQLVTSLAGGSGQIDHPLLQVNTQSNRTVLLVLTSNRGLCGGYNSNIIRMASGQIQQLKQAGRQIDLRASGKKAIQYFKFTGQHVDAAYTGFDNKTTYADVEAMADEFIDLYTKKEIDAVSVIYTRFISSAKFNPEILNLLPLASLEQDQSKAASEINIEDYIFSPSAEEILRSLIPTTVRTRLFQCFTDAIVSEQVARMRAMKAATDNADQMIRALSRQHNRARQTQITSELLDILGGVEALK